MPNRAAIPIGRPASGSPAARCAAATPTRPTSTRRSRPSASCARAGSDYDRYLDSYRAIELAERRGAARGRRRDAGRDRALPGVGPAQDGGPALRPASARRAEPRDAQPRARRVGLPRTWALAQRLSAAPTTRSTTSSAVEAYLGRRLHLHRGAAAPAAHARRLPVRRQDRLLPAVLGRDGAAAAHGRHPRARRHRLHVGLLRPEGQGVRRPRPRRPLVGRGVVPRVRLGDARPDAVGRAAALPAGTAAAPPSATRPTSAAPARLDPSAGARGRGRDDGGGLRRWLGAAGGAAARRRVLLAFRAPRRAAAGAPMAELERALRRTRRDARPGRDAAGARGAFARSPDAAGYVRALRDQRYGGRGEPPTSAQRRGLRASWRAAAACSGACARGGRCRRGGAGSRRTLDAHG